MSFTPLEDDGMGSLHLTWPKRGPVLTDRRSQAFHLVHCLKLVPLGLAPAADGCEGAYGDTSSALSLTRTQLRAIWLLYHPVRRGGIKDATCVFFSRSLSPFRLILVVFLKGAFNDKYHMAVGTGAFISAEKRSCNNVH